MISAPVFALAQAAATTQGQHQSLTEQISKWCEWFIGVAGYTGSAILMALESMIAPIPSEAVMPFVGVQVYNGQMNAWLAVLATTIGSLAGSLISYWLGYVGGKPLVMKVGRFLFINEHHLDLTISYFHKRGGTWTIFLARFIPVVRHFVSIPAGMGKMPLIQFCLATVVGATIWNSFLLYVGFKWAFYLPQLKRYYKMMDVGVIILGVLVVGLWIILHMKKKPKEAVESESR